MAALGGRFSATLGKLRVQMLAAGAQALSSVSFGVRIKRGPLKTLGISKVLLLLC
jgi:hypothetical protein